MGVVDCVATDRRVPRRNRSIAGERSIGTGDTYGDGAPANRVGKRCGFR